MATSSISPPTSRRPTMLFLSICTALLGMTACETDSTEPTAMSPAATQTITTDADPSNRSITSNFSASAAAKSVAPRYLLGTGKADITGAADETGMFGYAAGQVVQGINDRLYSHALLSAKRIAMQATELSMSQRIWARCLPRSSLRSSNAYKQILATCITTIT